MPPFFRAVATHGGAVARTLKRGSIHTSAAPATEQRRSSEFAPVAALQACAPLAPAPGSSSSSLRGRASAFSGINRRRVQSLRLEHDRLATHAVCGSFLPEPEQGDDVAAGPSTRRSVIAAAVAAPAPTSSSMKTVTVDLGDRR